MNIHDVIVGCVLGGEVAVVRIEGLAVFPVARLEDFRARRDIQLIQGFRAYGEQRVAEVPAGSVADVLDDTRARCPGVPRGLSSAR